MVLWCLSPREFAALRKQWERAREFSLQLYAGVQATLHNAHFRGNSHPQAFRMDDFLSKKPGASPFGHQTVEEKKAMIGAHMELLQAYFNSRKKAES